MITATRVTKIKPSNLELIKSGQISGSKFFAYIKLLNTKGVDIETKGKLKGGKMLYIGGTDYIGAKVIKFSNGSFKLHQIEGVIK